MKLIAQGAEAKVYETDDRIVKMRLPKAYRIPEIDRKITQQRLKREAGMLQRLQTLGIAAPRFLKIEGNELHMEKIQGRSVRDCLTMENHPQVLGHVGRLVAELHNADIIHGDLTTLNFIVGDRIYVIDFGLSFVSRKDEDKAVDLYMFERALKCGHSEDYLSAFYEGYRAVGSPSVLERLESVRQRGRKREETATG